MLTFLMLASIGQGVVPVSAGEVQILNSNFDDLAPTPAWSWENWSRPGSTATYDATLNAAGGAEGSGSLRLSAPFDPLNGDWQEAVFTLDTADFNASPLYSLSFDVKVDPASVPRLEGDYGNIQFILRNGNNWDWRQQTMVPLTNTAWHRVTVLLASGEQPIDDIRAITVRIAQSSLAGTVIVNIDNIAFTEETIIDDFDDGNIEGWRTEWGTSPELAFDPLDGYGRETSGSLRVAAPYFDPNITTWQQAVIAITFPEPVDAPTLYTHINVDLKVDPSSTLNRDGDYGYFEIKRPDGAVIASGVDLNGTEWQHLSFEIAPTDGTLSGVIIQLGSATFQGPVIYNLDNFTWTKRLSAPPPPTLSLERARTGLNLVHTSANQYGRHNIYSADSSQLGFYGMTESVASVSYSFALSSFPSGAAYPGFQAHLFLVPGDAGAGPDPDWTLPNIIFLDVKAGADGSGNATFRWKTNQANGNSQLYAAGLPVVNSASVLGTWNLTIGYETNVTLTAPDGATTSSVLDPVVAALFAGPIRVYLGVQGNSPNNVAQRASVESLKVTQESVFADLIVVLEDDFSGEALDTSKWVENTSAPGGVQFVPAAEAGWLVSWTLPDDGFVLQVAEELSEPTFWNNSGATPVTIGPARRQAHVTRSELPPTNQAYFRLFQPPPAQ